MRIVIDLQGAQTESRFRGIGRYSLDLAQAMAKQAGKHEVWVCLNAALTEADTVIHNALAQWVPPERIVSFQIPTPVAMQHPDNNWRCRAAELLREAFLAELQPDMVHVSSLFEGWLDDAALSVGTLTLPTPTAVTLYDLIPLLNPDTYLGGDWVKQWYMGKVEALKRASLLLAISDYSRTEALGHLGIQQPRITNISSAISSNFRPTLLGVEALRALKARYDINKPYLMYNGAFESRKNIERLLEAFAQLPSSLRLQYQLVLVGKVNETQRLHLQHLAKKSGITAQLVLTGYVPDDDLIALYSHCALFVFPSLHEGFGLPPLEAMACGAPTIGSKVTSIPEVIGRDDALFDPYQAQAITAKITQALTDKDFYQSLREYAPQQAAQFSWDHSAKRALTAFEEHHAQQVLPTKTWSIHNTQRQHSYTQVIEALVALPHIHVKPSDDDLGQVAKSMAENRALTDHLARQQLLPKKLDWRIEGPFDSSYSLALLNRETALALEALGHKVQLHSTEGPGDFDPAPDFLKANPSLAKLYKRSLKKNPAEAEVTSRNLYPPRVADMTCRFNLLHHYAWEESGFPTAWVDDFNAHLQGMTCLSQHVAKIMVDHGVTVPLSVSGCGVDHWERVVAAPDYPLTARSFRFLHVSSCFPRKGADSLLQAYGQAFSDADDVTLVIKTFANPHNEIHRWLAEAKAQRIDYPDVVIIEEDLSDAQLKALYQQCQVLVSPSRAEGFALPLAEAMLSGLAVITTAWGGQLEFCNPETAWLIDYQFVAAQSHFELFNSVWAEPDLAHLAQTLRTVYALPAKKRQARSARGRDLLLSHYTWQAVAQRLVAATRSLANAPVKSAPRIGWVTTWNTRCGIATYSAHLIHNMPASVTVLAAHTAQLEQIDGHEVQRCWQAGEHDDLKDLSQCVEDRQLDTLVVQFNYSLFNLERLGVFLTTQLDAGRTLVVMLHSTADPIHILPHKRLEKLREPLARCQRVLVHTRTDLNRLKALNLVDNVALFPHGILDYVPQPKAMHQDDFILASYGFFLPHKGLLELIQTVKLLRQRGLKVKLHMLNAEYPVPESAALIQQAQNLINELQLNEIITLQTAYLRDAESLTLLAPADLVVFPYQETGESASGAVRYGLVAGRPVAVTPLAIFDDIAPVVNYLPGTTPELMADGLQKLLTNPDPGIEVAASRWREAHRYSALGLRLNNMLIALKNSAIS